MSAGNPARPKAIAMRSEEWMERELEGIRSQGLQRRVRVFPAVGGKLPTDDGELLNFSSNDYLNLARHPTVLEQARHFLSEYGSGATASRLMTGTLPCHEELERRLATLKGYPSALLFASGYLANAGVIPALVGKDDSVFADRLAHASLVDGIVLSRATLHRFRHNDCEHLDQLLKKSPSGGRRLVVTESVFSMDGDLAPIEELSAIAERHDAMLMVDEAHATGVFGPAGSGLVRQCRTEGRVNVSMGTLSKALGACGGFVACSPAMRELLINRARTFIYTTAPPPPVVGAALGALDVLRETPGLGASLLDRSAFFRSRLRSAGLDTGPSASQIVPILVGNAEKAMELSRRLAGKKMLAVAIRPPTVPHGTARLRLSVTLAHTREDLEQAADTIAACAGEVGVR